MNDKQPKLKWDPIDRQIERTTVPGGWLVRWDEASSWGRAGGLTFVPDPDHRWDGKSLA